MAMYTQFWFACIHPVIDWIRAMIFPVRETACGFFFDMADFPIVDVRDI
jgi:hypothetical protein